jgi:hypothetical protein
VEEKYKLGGDEEGGWRKNKEEKHDISLYGINNYGVQRYGCHEHCPLCLSNPGYSPVGKGDVCSALFAI